MFYVADSTFMRSIHAAYSTSSIVSLLYHIPLHKYYINTVFMYTQLFLHSYVDIWVLSSFFCNNVIKIFYAYLLVHICVHFLSGMFLEMELLAQRLRVCSALVDITRVPEWF